MDKFNDPLEKLVNAQQGSWKRLDPRLKAVVWVLVAGAALFLVSEVLIRFGGAN
ncbi:MAG: hypothetical protein U1C73_05435 [Dietzia sp.]|nr:hypothetical protein [Dietzia sp.]